MSETESETQKASESQTPADLGQFDATQLAKLVAGASDEQLAEGMSDPENRKRALDEIFRRMSEHVDPERAKGTDAVLHWVITDRPGGGEDRYEVVLENGACTASDEPSRTPRVTFTIGPAPFLRLVSGAQAGPVLFMAGKLKIEGDLMFASQVANYFRIPQAAS